MSEIEVTMDCEKCKAYQYERGRTDERAKAVEKIEYLKASYIDACNLCTSIECKKCNAKTMIEDLDELIQSIK